MRILVFGQKWFWLKILRMQIENKRCRLSWPESTFCVRAIATVSLSKKYMYEIFLTIVCERAQVKANRIIVFAALRRCGESEICEVLGN
jgi:hypothetical protein